MMSASNIAEEKDYLNSLVVDYADQAPYSKIKKNVISSLIEKYTIGGENKSVLQLGCSNGYETNYLIDHFMNVDVVDGSSEFIKKMKEKNTPKANFIHSLFEEYDPGGKKYDYIFCNYVLEHVLDVVCVLDNIKKCLAKDGIIIAVVPNANAFSRRLAQQMGIISDLYELTKNDLTHGHRRVYDRSTLFIDFDNAGLEIVQVEGVIFKILADFQLNEMLNNGIISEEHIWGLQKMAVDQPELCDSIFVVAKTKS